MPDNRKILVNGYQAKPASKPNGEHRGRQANASPSPSANSSPPRSDQLLKSSQSTVKPAGKN